MDKTKKYARMCEKVEEIQVIGKAKATELDDWYYEKATQLYSIGTFADERDIWLPRQDQLQEMAWAKEYHEDNIDHLLMRFWNEIHTIPYFNYQYWGGFRTMEQKWLAFVMITRYNKVWNGKEWVEG